MLFFLQVSLVSEAVKLDEALNYKEAVKMYCKALDYFVPALQCELNYSLLLAVITLNVANPSSTFLILDYSPFLFFFRRTRLSKEKCSERKSNFLPILPIISISFDYPLRIIRGLTCRDQIQLELVHTNFFCKKLYLVCILLYSSGI